MTPEEAIISELKKSLFNSTIEIHSLRTEVHRLNVEIYGNNVDKLKPLIDKEMLKTLILLCHPDKHNNSSGSEKAIKFLLKLRK